MEVLGATELRPLRPERAVPRPFREVMEEQLTVGLEGSEVMLPSEEGPLAGREIMLEAR